MEKKNTIAEKLKNYFDTSVPREVAPDQRSLTDQLVSLVTLANRNGLYDAADFVNNVLEKERARQFIHRLQVGDVRFVSEETSIAGKLAYPGTLVKVTQVSENPEIVKVKTHDVEGWVNSNVLKATR